MGAIKDIDVEHYRKHTATIPKLSESCLNENSSQCHAEPTSTLVKH